jgi:phosphate transport system substrate-binding protein
MFRQLTVRFFSMGLALLAIHGVAAAQSTPTPAPEATPEAAVTPIVLPMIDPIDVRGDIIIAGSSTVYPLTERMKERFEEDGYTDTIVDESVGTGAGFERFCVAGNTDISNASRAIRPAEVEACQKIGRTPIEFRVGTDALVVVVSQANDFLTDLTLEELAIAFSTAETWSDVRAGLPDEPILRYAAGTESGTFDYFVEEVFDDDPAPLLAASNLRLSEDDNELVRGVEANPNAIGFFGFAYFLENSEKLRTIAIEGVMPEAQTAEDGTYPLARPLFIYSDAETFARKPQVAAFINYYLTHVNEYILEVGYFPASVEALNSAKQAWLDAVNP